MSQSTRLSKTDKLESITKKYVPDNELRDAPSRLFRQLLGKLQMNPFKWTNLLRAYLDWSITTQDRDKARAEAITRTGNIKDTYFHKNTLTMNKLIEGLSICQMQDCEIIIKTTDKNGVVHEVSEKFNISGSKVDVEAE